jgi:hypothetical protein
MYINAYILVILSICFNLNNTLIMGSKFTIINNCNNTLPIYSHENNQFIKKCNLENMNNCLIEYTKIEAGLIKTSLSEEATLFEFTINNKGIWYDISVIPPGSGNCYSYEECFIKSNKVGYNIPLEVTVSKSDNTCMNLICLNKKCNDAYLYPFDDLKTKFCNINTDFQLIYCPNSNENNLDCIE